MTPDETERHTDPNDLASELEMMFSADAIRTIQKRVEQKQKPLADGSYEFPECIECGGEIGEGRLRLAPLNTHCFECATFAEKQRSRLFAKE